METIPLPDQDILPMENIAEGVKGLRIIFTNVFGIRGSGTGWVLVDAGLPGSGGRIRSWAQEQFGREKPQAVLLTHGHFDHTGALEDLTAHWGEVPIFAHEREMPYLTGQTSYPPPDPGVGGGLMALMSPLYPRSPKNLGDRVRPFAEGERIPELSEWRWIETPGHTPGHTSFFREMDGTLLVGDAFCTTRAESFYQAAIDQQPQLSAPPAYYTPDWDQARESVRKLAALSPTVIAPGHGHAMQGSDIAAALQRFADNFDRLARPTHGKYAHGSPSA